VVVRVDTIMDLAQVQVMNLNLADQAVVLEEELLHFMETVIPLQQVHLKEIMAAKVVIVFLILALEEAVVLQLLEAINQLLSMVLLEEQVLQQV
jgi:hypothetical protein